LQRRRPRYAEHNAFHPPGKQRIVERKTISLVELVIQTDTKHVGGKTDCFRNAGTDVEQDRLAEIDVEISL
jgi:hypothetical protein